jgi:multiple sugar transport system permease protein
MAKIAQSLTGVRQHQRSQSRRKLYGAIAAHIALIGLSIVFFLPFLWLLSTSLKPEWQIFTFPPVWIPDPITFEHYGTGINFIPFWSYLSNTVIYCFFAVLGTLISSSLAAYSLARINWPGRNILFAILVAVMIVPNQVTIIPQFLIFRTFGWIDTLLPLTVPAFFGAPFFIFLLRQFFMTIPKELSEAARMDGASEWNIFWEVIIPLSHPVLATVGLFTFLNAWNDFLGPLVYLNSQSNYTLSIGLQQFRGQYDSLWGPLMAVTTVMTLPVIVAFFFTQRLFIQGITLTGIKG